MMRHDEEEKVDQARKRRGALAWDAPLSDMEAVKTPERETEDAVAELIQAAWRGDARQVEALICDPVLKQHTALMNIHAASLCDSRGRSALLAAASAGVLAVSSEAHHIHSTRHSLSSEENMLSAYSGLSCGAATNMPHFPELQFQPRLHECDTPDLAKCIIPTCHGIATAPLTGHAAVLQLLLVRVTEHDSALASRKGSASRLVTSAQGQKKTTQHGPPKRAAGGLHAVHAEAEKAVIETGQSARDNGRQQRGAEHDGGCAGYGILESKCVCTQADAAVSTSKSTHNYADGSMQARGEESVMSDAPDATNVTSLVRGWHGTLCLHLASAHGHSECVMMLIRAHADVCGGDCHGVTPLMEACDNGHERCVQMLLDARAVTSQ
eukprot:6182145-Pleurochrysis_carterae.AAC.1